MELWVTLSRNNDQLAELFRAYGLQAGVLHCGSACAVRLLWWWVLCVRSCFPVVLGSELTHAVVVRVHKVVVCGVNVGPWKLLSSSVLRPIIPPSGCPCPHSGWLCCWGKPLLTRGLESCFPVVLAGELTHAVLVCAHIVVVCVVGGGAYRSWYALVCGCMRFNMAVCIPKVNWFYIKLLLNRRFGMQVCI